MILGEQIKKYRKKAGLTQKQLGEKLGISQQQIAQYENGKRVPKIDALIKIANALNAKFSDLIPMNDTLEWISETIEEYRITRAYSAIDIAIKDNLDKMNEPAKKKVYNYTEDLIQNPKNRKDTE